MALYRRREVHNQKQLTMQVFALVDGNSFFASCEKVFRPDLTDRPVIVLSNTFATRMLEQGCDLFILQRAMGHTSVATTARYDFRSETSREKVCKNLEVFG